MRAPGSLWHPSLFCGRPLAYAEVMRSAVALNGSFFNAQRMVGQYLQNAYLAAGQRGEEEKPT